MPVSMIALDLDGTLLGADTEVSPRNLAALRAALDAGIVLAIATGRRHSYALKVLHPLALPGDTLLVSSNGAVVRTVAGTLIERSHMERQASEWLCTHLGEYRDALVITFDKLSPGGEDQRGALVVEDYEAVEKTIGRWVSVNSAFIEVENPIERCLTHGEQPIQMMLAGSVERMRRAEARLLENSWVAAVGETRAEARISLNRTEYPDRDLSIVDILPAGCSKGAALLRLCAARNIPAASLMAIGDNWNDLSMLSVAGYPVLMGDAPADLKAIAATHNWPVTASNLEDGVAQAIEQALAEQVRPELLTTEVSA